LPLQKQAEVLESFAMAFEKSPTGAILNIGWDNLRVSLPIQF
jgi:hypothetical protein